MLAFAGCGDPEASHLAVGSKAMIVDHYKKYDRVYLKESGDSMWPDLTLGTHVTVVEDEDDGKGDDNPAVSAGKGWGTRRVKVHVEDGQFQGKTGIVTRWNLRPE